MEYLNGSRLNHGNGTSEGFDRLFWYLLPTVIAVPPLAIPTNGLVIHLLLDKPGVTGSTPEIFTLQLACFDMLFCFLLVIEFILFVYCKSVSSSFFVAWGLKETGGPLLLCLLSVDSYICVCHPLVFRHLKDRRVRLSVCLLVCVITGGSCWMVKTVKPYKWNTIIGLLFIVILIISICTFEILKSLRKSGPNRKEVHPVKRRAFKVVLTSYLLVSFHHIPPIIEHQLRRYAPEYFPSFSILTGVSLGFLSLATFTQPLSYLVRTKQLLRDRRHCDSAANAAAATTTTTTTTTTV